MPSSPTARDAAEGLAETEAEDARVQAALRVWREIHDTANVDDDPEDLDYAAMSFALAEADKLRADVLLPGHVPMPRTADEAKAMWLIGERWIRDNAPEMIRSAGTEGGETQGAVEMREACLRLCCSALYGPPSSWPGAFPHAWKPPLSWDPGRVPTPEEAALHDNGVTDAWIAILTGTRDEQGNPRVPQAPAVLTRVGGGGESGGEDG